MLDAIKDVLVNEFKYIFGKNLFINHYPDNPDVIVSIIDNRGFSPSLYYPTRERVVEFKVRANTHDEGRQKAEEIFDYFHSKENYYLSDIKVIHSYGLTDVSYLYADSMDRNEYSFELVFLIQK